MKTHICFLTLCVLCATFAFAQQGVITEVSGTVELKKSSSQIWEPATAGSAVTADTIVSTGLKSSAVIQVGNSIVTVRPLTRLTLEELVSSSGTETVKIGLQTGRVRAKVTPPPGGSADFSIRSPSVTASVRGTAFEMSQDSLNVSEGQVSFAGSNGFSVAVNAGESSRSDAKGNASRPADTVIALAPSVEAVADMITNISADSTVTDIITNIVDDPIIPDNPTDEYGNIDGTLVW